MSDVNISAFAEELMKVIMRIRSGAMKTCFDFSGLGKITIPQFSALIHIEAEGDHKMKDLAKELNISLPAATGMIGRLHKFGMVKRTVGEDDRRVVTVALTEKGKKIMRDVRNQHKKMIESVFGRLTEEERADYLRIIKKIGSIVNEE